MIATRWPWLLLGAGVLSLSVALLVMMRTRWGQARPLSKCAVLSVWAHLMLLGFASLTNWWIDPPRRPPAQTIRVSWLDTEQDGQVTGDAGADAVEASSSSDANFDEPAEAPVVEGAESDEELAESEGAPDLLPTPEPIATAQADLTESEKLSAPMPDGSVPSELPDADVSKEALTNQERSQPAAKGDTTSDSDRPPALSETTAIRQEAEARPLENSSAMDVLVTAEDAEQILKATAVPDVELDEPVASRVVSQVSTASKSVDLNGKRLPRKGSRRDLPAIYQGRDPALRKQLVLQANGSPDAERAVQSGLDWLAAAQDPTTGRWSTRQWGGGREIREFSDASGSIDADTALTGLALLAFLGSGYTHQEGPYQETVQRGLEFLLSQQSPETGSLAGSAGRYVAMYCHGMATFALSETLVMSGDDRLRQPVHDAIQWTVRAQHPTSGGWRYELGDVGDTSQFGWQVMSLVSARAAGIDAPTNAWQRADRWLDRVSMGSSGGLACYVPDQRRATPSMTAEAAACRFFLQSGMRPDAWNEASQMIVSHGPSWQGTLDLYYCYYATLAMYLAQDPQWSAWNERLTRELLRRQESTGAAAGSWDTRTRWGAVGGRVYTTSMACLCLETCYRYLPVYRVAQSNDSKWRRSDR